MSSSVPRQCSYQLETVQDLIVLIAANLKRFLLVSGFVFLAFIIYGYLQPLQYRYSTTLQLPRWFYKGGWTSIVTTPMVNDYVRHLPSIQSALGQFTIPKTKLAVRPSSGGDYIDITLDAVEHPELVGVLNQAAQSTETYFKSLEEKWVHDLEVLLAILQEQLKKADSGPGQIVLAQKASALSEKLGSFSMSARIVSGAERSDQPLNLSLKTWSLLGVIIGTIIGTLSIVLSAFISSVRARVHTLSVQTEGMGS